MSLLLDTSIVIDIERKDAQTLNTLRELSEEYPGIPSISLMTYTELLVGFLRGKRKDKEKENEILDKFHTLSASKKTARKLSELKYETEQKGQSLSLADLFIAAQAMENNLLLVTKDTDFEKIEGLNKMIL